MKKFILFAFALTATLAPGWAQDPAATSSTATPQTSALAEELLSTLKLDQTMNGVFSQMAKMQDQALEAKNLPPETKAKQKAIMGAAMAEVQKSFTWDAIKPTFIEIYAEVFSVEELQGMIDFFKSSIGQKWIAKQPQLQAATMQKMQGLMMELQPKIQAAIQKATEAQAATPKPTP